MRTPTTLSMLIALAQRHSRPWTSCGSTGSLPGPQARCRRCCMPPARSHRPQRGCAHTCNRERSQPMPLDASVVDENGTTHSHPSGAVLGPGYAARGRTPLPTHDPTRSVHDHAGVFHILLGKRLVYETLIASTDPSSITTRGRTPRTTTRPTWARKPPPTRLPYGRASNHKRDTSRWFYRGRIAPRLPPGRPPG